MKKKIVNADDHEVLNPIADSHNDGAVTDIPDGLQPETVNDAGEPEEYEPGKENEITKDEKPFPDEIASPKEQDEQDEMA